MANGAEDIFGNSFGSLSSSDIVNKMLAPVGPAQTVEQGAEVALMNKLVAQIQELNKKQEKQKEILEKKLPDEIKKRLEDVAKEDRKFLKKLFDEKFRSVSGRRTARNSQSGGTSDLLSNNKIRKGLEALEMGSKPGSFYTHDIHVEKAVKQLVRSLNKTKGGTAASSAYMGKAAGAGRRRVDYGGLPGQYLSKEDRLSYLRASQMEDEETRLELLKDYNAEQGLNLDLGRKIWVQTFGSKKTTADFLHQATQGLGKITSSFMTLATQDNLVVKTFDGIAKNHVDMVKSMRMYAYETGQSAEKAIELATAGGIAAETGQKLADYQKSYLKSLKMGIKDQKQATKITKIGMQLATAIGSDADSTADHMAKVSMHMGLSNMQAEQFSRHIKFAAEATGVTGDNLMNAVKQSEGLMKNMRGAGNLSGIASGNITQLTASLEKFGVGGEFAPILEAISSPSKFFNAAPEMQALVAQAANRGGVSDQLMTGQLLSDKKSMKAFASGMEDLLMDFTGGKAIEDLTAEERMVASVQFERLGISIGAAEQGLKALKEGSMSGSELMQKYTAELNDNITAQEKTAIQEKILGIKIKETSDIFAGLDNSLKKGGDAFGDLEKMLKKGKGAELKEMGIDVTGMSGRQAASKIMGVQIDAVNEMLSKAGLDKRIDAGRAFNMGPEEIRQLSADIAEAQREAEVKLKTDKDPQIAAAQYLKEINELLQNYVGGWTQWAFDSLGKWGLIGANIALVAKDFGLLRPLMDGVFNKLAPLGNFAKESFLDMFRLGGRSGGIGGKLGGFGKMGSFGAMAGRAGAGIGGIGSGLSGGLGSMGGLSKLIPLLGKGAALLGKFALPLGLLIGIVSSIPRTFETWVEKMKQGDFAGAITGGATDMLLGIIDSFTFGFFSDFLGKDGMLYKGIEGLIKFIPGLGGVVVLAEGLTYAFKQLSPAMEYAMKVLNGMYDSFMSWLSPDDWSNWWNDTETNTEIKKASESMIAGAIAGASVGAKKAAANGDFTDIKNAISAEQTRLGISADKVGALNAQTVGSGNADALKKAFPRTDGATTVNAAEASADAAQARFFKESRGVFDEDTTSVTPSTNSDSMHKQIRREIAGTTPGAGAGEANSIARELQVQTLIARQQVEVLTAILNTLQASGDESGGGDTSTKLAFRPPAQYYKWSTRYSDNAQLNVSLPTH